MFSTRNTPAIRRSRVRRAIAAVAVMGMLAPSLTGCSAYKRLGYQRPTEPAMDPNGPPDEAMATRQWKQQEALFANSGVTAYANRFRYNYETSRELKPYAGVLAGPLAFIGQTFTFPFTFLRAPIGATETYRPLSVEPTFTANPVREPLGPATGSPEAAPSSPGAPVPGLPPQTPAAPGGVPPAPGAPGGAGAPVDPGGSGGAGGPR
jgi:hypothetical protein